MMHSITIYNREGIEKLTIPVLSDTTYVCELMSAEYVSVVFNHYDPKLLSLGDYIQYNGIRFKVIELAYPAIQKNGYRYQQKFCAPWMEFSHRKLMYDRGQSVETGWTLTAFPNKILALIVSNVESAINRKYAYEVSTNDIFNEMKVCDFSNSTDIIEALNTMADDNHWQTEWWIEDYAQADSNGYVGKIHFGSCERNSAITLTDEHLSAVNRSDSQNGTKATRLYAFGSDKNVTKYYHKEVEFTVTNSANGRFKDANHAVGFGNFKEETCSREVLSFSNKTSITLGVQRTSLLEVGCLNSAYKTAKVYSDVIITIPENKGGIYDSNIALNISLSNFTSWGLRTDNGNAFLIHPMFAKQKAHVKLYSADHSTELCDLGEIIGTAEGEGNVVRYTYTNNIVEEGVSYRVPMTFTMAHKVTFVTNINKDINILGGSYCLEIEFELYLCGDKIRLGVNSYPLFEGISNHSLTVLTSAKMTNPNPMVTTTAIIGGESKKVWLNPEYYNPSNETKFIHTDGMVVFGTSFRLSKLVMANIPQSWMTSSLPKAIQDKVATNRLLLPNGVDYVDVYEDMPQEQVVEGVIINEDIYPKMTMTIGRVESVAKESKDEYTGEDITVYEYDVWLQDMAFDTKYQIDGTELHIVFQTGTLAGMDFNVLYDPESGADNTDKNRFRIIANENYGGRLPKDSLIPSVGDTAILYGFDTSYLDDKESNAVSQAEQSLLQWAQNKAAETRKDTATYDCTMNLVKCHADGFLNLQLGQKVTFNSGIYGSNSTRIRKIEKALDGRRLKYTIGGSAAKSRLKALEKEIKNK